MADRPNILVIMTDQQRGDALSLAGHPVLQTPNMDAIAAAGARFSRAYVTCPSCIAARRSLLSGQFPSTHGMVGYADGVPWDAPVTLPQALRDAGYQTALVGRSMHQHPARRRFGFDQMVLHGMADDYGRWLAERAPQSGGWFGGGVMHNDWTARPWHLDEHLHNTNWTVTQALEFLHHQRDPSCPLFMVVSFIAPHPPLQPPAFYLERYLRQELPPPVIGDWAAPPPHDGLGDDVASGDVHLTGERLRCARAGYFGLINHVDDQIRRLLNPVDGINKILGSNTVVLFLSDHGEMLGDHHRWRKSVPFEGSANIPLLIRLPRQFNVQPRTVIDQPVCIEDVMPTLLDLAGVAIPESVEGRSLLPLMRGEAVTWREHLPIEHAPIHQSMTDGREKFVWFVADGRELYFDLSSDPQERHNRVADPACAERVAYWRSALIERLASRPEGFVENGKLVPGRPYRATLTPRG